MSNARPRSSRQAPAKRAICVGMNRPKPSRADESLVSAETVRVMASAQQIREVEVVATEQGFVAKVRAGMTDRLLRADRGGPRTFAKIDTAAKYLRSLGVGRLSVDLSNLPAVKQRALFETRGGARRRA